MRISAELSLYPLQEDYIAPIHAFLDALNQCADVSVRTNAMSTHVYGEYDAVMAAIQGSLKSAFASGAPMSLVSKIISLDRENSHWNS